jgi:hypothetical protein
MKAKLCQIQEEEELERLQHTLQEQYKPAADRGIYVRNSLRGREDKTPVRANVRHEKVIYCNTS